MTTTTTVSTPSVIVPTFGIQLLLAANFGIFPKAPPMVYQQSQTLLDMTKSVMSGQVTDVFSILRSVGLNEVITWSQESYSVLGGGNGFTMSISFGDPYSKLGINTFGKISISQESFLTNDGTTMSDVMTLSAYMYDGVSSSSATEITSGDTWQKMHRYDSGSLHYAEAQSGYIGSTVPTSTHQSIYDDGYMPVLTVVGTPESPPMIWLHGNMVKYSSSDVILTANKKPLPRGFFHGKEILQIRRNRIRKLLYVIFIGDA